MMAGSVGEGNRGKKTDKPNVPFAHSQSKARVPALPLSSGGSRQGKNNMTLFFFFLLTQL